MSIVVLTVDLFKGGAYLELLKKKRKTIIYRQTFYSLFCLER